MDSYNILVVEDDQDINRLLCKILEGGGYCCRPAFSGSEAVLWAEQYDYDLILLDLMLPGLTGEEFIEQMRRKKTMPIIVLSAKAGLESRVNVLKLGADDFIPKPFDNAEVLARVEALCRRVGRSGGGSAADENAPTTLVSGEFVLDENRRVLLKAGRQIELTQVEFQIMELFFHNPGIALVREKILKGVWGENYFGDVKIVDVNIRRLRMKVEDEPSHPTHIMTVWGYGYRWEE